MKLVGHEKAQATVFHHNGQDTLWSYNTPVLFVYADGWVVCTGLYSATTRRHIGWFLKELYPMISFADIKAMVEGHYDYNYLTGEIRPLS